MHIVLKTLLWSNTQECAGDCGRGYMGKSTIGKTDPRPREQGVLPPTHAFHAHYFESFQGSKHLTDAAFCNPESSSHLHDRLVLVQHWSDHHLAYEAILGWQAASFSEVAELRPIRKSRSFARTATE